MFKKLAYFPYGEDVIDYGIAQGITTSNLANKKIIRVKLTKISAYSV